MSSLLYSMTNTFNLQMSAGASDSGELGQLVSKYDLSLHPLLCDDSQSHHPSARAVSLHGQRQR